MDPRLWTSITPVGPRMSCKPFNERHALFVTMIVVTPFCRHCLPIFRSESGDIQANLKQMGAGRRAQGQATQIVQRGL